MMNWNEELSGRCPVLFFGYGGKQYNPVRPKKQAPKPGKAAEMRKK